MSANLTRVAAENNIKYFLISFVDLFGVLRSKLVPARAIGEMQKEGAGFAGFAAWLDMTPAHPDNNTLQMRQIVRKAHSPFFMGI